MKKILQFGLLTMLVSGFMSVNAVEMNGATASSSSDQLTPEQRMAKIRKTLSQSLPTIVAEYKALKSSVSPTAAKHSIVDPTEKVEYSALYDLIMAVKECCFDWEIEQQIMPMIRSLEKPYNESLIALVDAVKRLKNEGLLFSTFKTVDDCSPYLDIVSIVNSKKRTIGETFRNIWNLEFCLDFDVPLLEGESKEEAYTRRMRLLEVLHKANLTGRIRFYVDDLSSKLLFKNLKLEDDRKLCAVEFFGSKEKRGLTSKIPFQVMAGKNNIWHLILCDTVLTNCDDLYKFLIDHETSVLVLDSVDVDRASVRNTVDFSKTSIDTFAYWNIRSLDAAYFWLTRLPKETVTYLLLQFNDDVSSEEKLKIREFALKLFPNVETLEVR